MEQKYENNPWMYNNIPFTSEMIEDHVGFVYLIEDLTNNKKYVGKKLFRSITKAPPLKGKTRKRTIIKESDWKTYSGSNDQLKSLVESLGRDSFKYEILHLCNSKGELSYMELFEQVKRGVLMSDEYYNGIIQVKIHSSHVKHINNDDLDFNT
jgi:hypothetical protein